MYLQIIIKILIALAWIKTGVSALKFCFGSLVCEDRKYLFLLFFAVLLMFVGNFMPAVKGGYDNNHDIGYVASSFSYFNLDKETSPILIKTLTDILSRYSLKAILALNRILPVLSMIMLYACLKLCGTGRLFAIFGISFYFLNFNHFLCSSSMSSTSVIVFLLVSIISAFFACCYSCKYKSSNILWFFSSAVLVTLARVEFLPVISIFSAVIIFKLQKSGFFQNRTNCVVFSFYIFILFFCAAYEIFAYYKMTIGVYYWESPLTNFHRQFLSENIAVMLSGKPVSSFAAFHFSVGFADYFLLALFAAHIAISIRKKNLPAVIFLLCFIYNCLIFRWQDLFPLHFMRHRAFFMLPLAGIAAFILRDLSCFLVNKINVSVKQCLYISLVFIASYFSVNFSTAKSLDAFLRSNDLEWQFLLSEEDRIKGKYYIEPDLKDSARRGLLQRYFSAEPYANAETLIYISPDYFSFEEFKSPEWNVDNLSPFSVYSSHYRFHTFSANEKKDNFLFTAGFFTKNK